MWTLTYSPFEQRSSLVGPHPHWTGAGVTVPPFLHPVNTLFQFTYGTCARLRAGILAATVYTRGRVGVRMLGAGSHGRGLPWVGPAEDSGDLRFPLP